MKHARTLHLTEQSTKRIKRIREELPSAQQVVKEMIGGLGFTEDQQRGILEKAKGDKTDDYEDFPFGEAMIQRILPDGVKQAATYMYAELFDPLSAYVHCGALKLVAYRVEHEMQAMDDAFRFKFLERLRSHSFIVSYLSGAFACHEVCRQMSTATSSLESVTEFWEMIRPISLHCQAISDIRVRGDTG